MSVSSGGLIEAVDFNSLRARILAEAARRGIGAPAMPAEVAGYETENCSASAFDQLIAGMNYLAGGTPPDNFSLYNPAEGFDMSAWGLLLANMSALEGDSLIYQIPTPFYVSDGATYQIGGTLSGTAPNRVFNCTTFLANANYCGDYWHDLLAGSADAQLTAQGYEIIQVGGKNAERIYVQGNFRRGCGCGNDQRIYRTYWIHANNSSGGLTVTASEYANQWGC